VRSLLGFVGTKALAGVLWLLPLAIVVLVAMEIVGLLLGVVDPLAEQLPISKVLGIELGVLLALALIGGLCFVVGAVMETGIGRRINVWLERVVLGRLPGYELAKNLTRGLAGTNREESFSVCLVQLFESGPRAVALVVEERGDSCTVFVPQTPTPTLGHVYVVPSDRIEVLDVPATSLLNSIMQWGIGTQALIAGAGHATSQEKGAVLKK